MKENIRIYKMDDIGRLNCKNCNRNVVCTLYRGLTTLIKNNWSPDSSPFQPENAAIICKYFLSEIKENL
jgi:hypothetical protein